MLIFMRHGQTDWNKTGRLASRTDIVLNNIGMEQCHVAGFKNKDIEISNIFCSPAIRAFESAKIFGSHQESAVNITSDENLVEIDFGLFEGVSGEEIRKSSLAGLYNSWLNGQEVYPQIGCEKWCDVDYRVNEVFKKYARFPGNTLIVSHGYFIRTLVARCVVGSQLSDIRNFRLDNAKFVAVQWEAGLPRLVAFNVSNLSDAIDDTPTS